MSKHYVVYGCERLRDGIEEWAKIVGSLEAATALLNQWGDRFHADSMTFKVFELGKEVQVTKSETEQPQPSIRTTVYKVEK